MKPAGDPVAFLLPGMRSQSRPRRLVHAARSHQALRPLKKSLAALCRPRLATETAKRQMAEAALDQMLRAEPPNGAHVRADPRQSQVKILVVQVHCRQTAAAEDPGPFGRGRAANDAVPMPMRQPIWWRRAQLALIEKH